MSKTTDKVAGKAEEMYGKATNQKDHEIHGKMKSTKADMKMKIDKLGKKLTK